MRDPLAEPSDLIRSVSRALRVLEAVGRSPRGLTVKQVARRCDLTVATTYHLVRTLAYEGYVIRREDGTYVVGLEIADRFRELVAAFRGPASIGESLRRAAVETGYSHYLGRFIGGHVAITAVAEGPRSPYLEELVPGFDEGAHATALGKGLLATLSADQRSRFLKEAGMRPYTPQTLTSTDVFEADLAAGDKRGMQLEIGQYRPGVACAAVLVNADRDVERRVVLACSMPAAELMTSARVVRTKLLITARNIADQLDKGELPGPISA
ncbi:MAG TPA: helix-turn-helix domain-containing protein [Micromonosporaceae bacterium]|nr:helix-turn-helix domain-containing protein [Micromonosporaceae bacterium]